MGGDNPCRDQMDFIASVSVPLMFFFLLVLLKESACFLTSFCWADEEDGPPQPLAFPQPISPSSSISLCSCTTFAFTLILMKPGSMEGTFASMAHSYAAQFLSSAYCRKYLPLATYMSYNQLILIWKAFQRLACIETWDIFSILEMLHFFLKKESLNSTLLHEIDWLQ